MTDILLPPWLNIASTVFSYRDSTGVSASPFNGAIRTAARGGDKLAASLQFTATGGSSSQVERAALIRFLMQLRGKQNRAYLYDPGYRQRGSFSAPELLTNNTFSNGTSGWNAAGGASIAVTDRVMRVTRGSSASSPRFNRSSIATTALAPYCMRAFIYDGRSSAAPSVLAFVEDGTLASQTIGPGLASAVFVSPTTSFAVAVVDGQTTGVAGDYFEVPYVSLARCALVDAGVNLFTRSDELNDAVWIKIEATVTANATVAPDGSSTADDVVDNGVNAEHTVFSTTTVASAAADVQFSIPVKARSRNFCRLDLADGTTIAEQYFDISAGTVGSGTTGASWTNRRAFISSLGNGWYLCTVLARKPAGATSLSVGVKPANSDGGATYAGSSTAAIAVWRATASLSGVPARLKQTTSAAAPNGENQNGSSLHLKGLPASTSNLLLPGDVIEVIGGRGSELKIVTAPLHSDAAGLGHLQFEPPMRSSPVDNAAVIVNQPFGRFIFAGDLPQWSTEPGIITTASADFEEV